MLRSLSPFGQPHVLSVVLAGGEGRRLWPLTLDRAKPAVPAAEASAFGIIEQTPDGEIRSFTEKPPHAKEIPGRPGWALASMGNYIFSTATLVDELRRDQEVDGAHDFGRNILPSVVGQRR